MNNKQLVEKRIRELIPELALGEHDMVNHVTGEVERVVEFGNIHLEHVLRAIKNVLYYRDDVIKTNALSRYRLYKKQVIETLAFYDLTKPFNEQSEELYNFLLEILNNQT